jgi:hypothetical protein
MIAAVLEGKLKPYRMSNLHGYAGVYVQAEDVERHVRPDRPHHPTVSEFGTQIGMTQDGGFAAFVRAGHLPSTRLYNPRTQKVGAYMTGKNVAAFYASYTTVKLISAEIDRDPRWVSQQLRTRGIQHFCPEGIDYGPLYLKQDTEQFVRETKFDKD